MLHFYLYFLYCMIKTNEYRDVLVDSSMESGETYVFATARDERAHAGAG